MLQVIGIKKLDGGNFKRALLQCLSLEVSDGVGSASLIVNRDTMAEIDLAKM